MPALLAGGGRGARIDRASRVGMFNRTRSVEGGGANAAGDQVRLVGCGLALAIVVAPFLALLLGLVAGLAVMAVALGATAFLAGEAARGAAAPVRRRLRGAAVVNAALALACLAALVARLA